MIFNKKHLIFGGILILSLAVVSFTFAQTTVNKDFNYTNTNYIYNLQGLSIGTSTTNNNAITFSDGTTFDQTNASASWTTDSTGIHYNSGNVGIGVTDPNSKLDVNGAIYGTIYYDKDNTSYYVNPSGGTSALFSGDVGIGTTNPSTNLVVEGSDSSNTSIEVANTGTGNATICLDANGGQCTGTDYLILRQEYSGNSVIGNWNSGGDLTFKTSNNDRMIIKGNGDVGIGDTTPNDKLEVNGNVRANMFYDRNNTSYYINPSASGISANFAGNISADSYYNRSNSTKRIFSPDGASNYWSGSTTGAIKIDVPNNRSMITVTVRIYDYQTNDSFTVIASGYLYLPGPNWSNTSAQIIGTSPNTDIVRFARDSGDYSIIIGNTGTSWSYTHAAVTDVTIGYGDNHDWQSGWSVSQVTSYPASIDKTHSNLGYVNIAGDTMQGSLNMNSNKITNLGTPSSGSDATTKSYVDSASVSEADNSKACSADSFCNINMIDFSNQEQPPASGGRLYFDENFYNNGYGDFSGNGGGLAVYNQDGWGAIYTTANDQWASPTFSSVNSSIFYDSDNTSYYINPSSGSVSANLNGRININRNGQSGDVIDIQHVEDSDWPFVFRSSSVGNDNASGFWVNSNGTPDMRLRANSGTVTARIHSSGNSYLNGGNVGIGDSSPSDKLEVNGNVRANMLYDRNNTSYYLNPAGRSHLDTITTPNKNFGGDYGTSPSRSNGISLGNGGGEGFTMFKQNPGNSASYCGGSDYNDCYIFMMSDGNAGYESGAGILFARNDGDGAFDPIMEISQGGYMDMRNNNITNGRTIYGTNFVDENNTSYNVNPSGTSNFSKLKVQGEQVAECNSQNIGSDGWYRIADNGPVSDGGSGGSRAHGKFTVYDTESGEHSSVTFYASTHYGNNPNITVLSRGEYSGGIIDDIRLVEGGTYEGAAVEIYAGGTDSSTNVGYCMYDNIQSSGWSPVDWTSGSVPAGFSTTNIDLNLDPVIASASNGGSNDFWINRSGGASLSSSLDMNNNNIADVNNIYANTFYDDNNTSYYANPASKSNFNTLTLPGNRIGFINSSFDAEIRVNDQNPYSTGAEFHFWGDGVEDHATLYADTYYAQDNMRAPIFYDSNNSSYYMNPSGNSKINGDLDFSDNNYSKGNDIVNVNTINVATFTSNRGTSPIQVASNQGGFDLNQNDIVDVDKIDANTVDPVYNIGDSKYATYMAGMTGVKEETTGSVQLTKNNKDYTHTIDFQNLEKGSDLWIFYQTSDFGENWNNLSVLLTGDIDAGNLTYEEIPSEDKLIIHGQGEGKVSYRLTAPRFDHDKWSNDYEGDSEGMTVPTVK